VTGSYDKKIILYDYSRGQVTSAHSNKSAVTSIVLTSDKQVLVSSGLDFSLLIWHISKKSNVKIINN
jgi:WD40 repeat protein